MLTGTNLKFANEYNVRIVLETIRLYGPVSRADVARRTELTAQTVTNITRKLIAQGMIEEGRRLQEGRGAPSVLLSLRADSAFSIGLDLDKDHLTGVLVDLVGNVRQRRHVELNFPLPEEAMDLLTEMAQALAQDDGLRLDRVWGVGVGVPGPLDISEDSVVTNVTNPKAFPGWHNVPVADILARRLGLPIFLENNATAAAVGERRYGAFQHIKTFFYVFFGAGLGGGLIINGHPYEGHLGNAGELGYVPTSDEIEPSEEFKRPHLGVYFNIPRLYRLLQEQGEVVTHPDRLLDLFDQKNECLMTWIEEGVRHLAPVILSIEFLIDPEAIFFGGRLPNRIILAMMDQLEKILPTMRIEEFRSAPRLIAATAGADAAALGVATLPMYAAFAPAPRVMLKNTEFNARGAFAPATRRAPIG